MAQKDKATLTALFETGDTPTGTDFADLIDSQVNTAETSAQNISSSLTGTTLGLTGDVSAQTGEFANVTVSGAVSAVSLFADNATVSAVAATIVSATTLVATTAKVSALEVSGNSHMTGNLVIDGDLEAKGTTSFTATEVGEIFAATTALVSASATYVNVMSNASADATFLVNFESSANGLVYKGSTARSFLAIGAISVSASQNNVNTFLAFAIDGSAQNRTEIEIQVGTAIEEIQTHGMLRLSPESTVQLQVKSDVAGAVGFSIPRALLTVKD